MLNILVFIEFVNFYYYLTSNYSKIAILFILILKISLKTSF